jgi:hypothetical protein
VVDRAVAEVYARVPPRPISTEQFAAKVDAFWFVAQLAAHKAVRGDLLMASHLSLQLRRDCMELAMQLRDRATGVHHHRHGGEDDAAILSRLSPEAAFVSAPAVLDTVERAGALFDDLAAEWDLAYQRRMHMLQPLVDSIREHVIAPNAVRRAGLAPRPD